MNTFIVIGTVIDSRLSGRCLTIILQEKSGLRHQLLAFGGTASKLFPSCVKSSTIQATASRRLDGKSELQYWLCSDVNVLVAPPFFQE